MSTAPTLLCRTSDPPELRESGLNGGANVGRIGDVRGDRNRNSSFIANDRRRFVGGVMVDVDRDDARPFRAKSAATALPFPHPRPEDPAPKTSATLS